MHKTYQIETRYCHRDGKQIYGQLYRPNTEEKVPLVIYAHELSCTLETGIPYAQALAKQGIAVYLFDFCGGSPRSRSDGKTTEMSVLTEARDLEAVLAAAKQWDGIDDQKILFLGASQGGMAAAMAAAWHPQDIFGLILLYPGFSIRDSNAEHFGTEPLQEVISYRGWLDVGPCYVNDVQNYDVYADLPKFSGPVLLLHGDRDTLVPLSYSERAVQLFPNARLQIISNAGHGFWYQAFTDAMQSITEFLQALHLLQ